MALKPEAIASIQVMLEADPALLAQVQSCTDSAAAAAMILKAAAAQGLDFGSPDAMAPLGAALAAQASMSDAELEWIAGGRLILAADGNLYGVEDKHRESGDSKGTLYRQRD